MVARRFFRDLAPPELVSQRESVWIGCSELNYRPLSCLPVALPLRLERCADVSVQFLRTAWESMTHLGVNTDVCARFVRILASLRCFYQGSRRESVERYG